VVAVAIWNL